MPHLPLRREGWTQQRAGDSAAAPASPTVSLCAHLLRCREDWTWQQAAETYALDPEMAEKLRQANPQVPLCCCSCCCSCCQAIGSVAVRGMPDA